MSHYWTLRRNTLIPQLRNEWNLEQVKDTGMMHYLMYKRSHKHPCLCLWKATVESLLTFLPLWGGRRWHLSFIIQHTWCCAHRCPLSSRPCCGGPLAGHAWPHFLYPHFLGVTQINMATSASLHSSSACTLVAFATHYCWKINLYLRIFGIFHKNSLYPKVLFDLTS